MEIKRAKVADLAQDPRNVRHHGPRNMEAITASLQRFGQQKPIVVDGEGVVVAGNGTLAAAAKLGWAEINVVHTPLVGAEARAFAVADNRSSELASWTDDLGPLLAELVAEDIPHEALGFSDDELRQLVDPDMTVPDPSPLADPTVADVTIVVTATRKAFEPIQSTVEQWASVEGLTVSIG